MKQYLDLLQNILDNGVEKESGRANMPNTIGLSHGFIEMDLSAGFPLLTTKKMFLKGIIHELLWFLRGETNIKYLVDNGVHIWDSDAYRWYLKQMGGRVSSILPIKSQEQFIEYIKAGKEFERRDLDGNVIYRLGDLGKVYGYQWRNQHGIDQIKDLVDGLKNNPYSRYHIIDGWNKADFPEMALPPCHLLYQFIVRPMTQEQRIDYAKNNGYEEEYYSILPIHYDELKTWLDNKNIPKFYLDMNMYQRSCDTLLGVPFNLASMSLLLMIIAKVSNMLPGVAYWTGGDVHVYVDHIPMVQEQLKRIPKGLPNLIIKKELKTLDDILSLEYEDFVLTDYDPDDAIKAELFTGVKK
jgi:thymidylate synthase